MLSKYVCLVSILFISFFFFIQNLYWCTQITIYGYNTFTKSAKSFLRRPAMFLVSRMVGVH